MKTLHNNENQPSKCNKLEIYAAALVCFFIVFNPLLASAKSAVTIDGALAGAIGTQIKVFNDAYSERKKLREATITAQFAVTYALETVHAVENEALKYMKETGNVLTNLIQLKNIAENAVQLPIEMKNLLTKIPNNPKGAAITAVATKKFVQTGTDIVELANLVKKTVTSSYSFSDKGKDKKDGKKHVNLLSSAERYSILMDVDYRLKRIKRDIRMLGYYIETLSWEDLWRGMDRKSYYKAIQSKYEIESIKRNWNKLTK